MPVYREPGECKSLRESSRASGWDGQREGAAVARGPVSMIGQWDAGMQRMIAG
jgi:hypothetical protein